MLIARLVILRLLIADAGTERGGVSAGSWFSGGGIASGITPVGLRAVQLFCPSASAAASAASASALMLANRRSHDTAID
ncbi:hypothetical protein FB566_2909 [Stackebrandtia endophytica]|uniref:Uncharacterized protein n=1 Tax=Stackebrandtia endophytica TaxID=1496996 RepID=A0A543AXS4_9ACTN|nr:hypothetical protein FB566_2909 [Stackebrandtia endophytica]